MNSKRTNNLTKNQQPIDNNGLLLRTTNPSNNAENDDPHPNIINDYNIINAAELNLDLLPKKLKNVNNSRSNAKQKNGSVTAADKTFDRNKAREHIAEQQRKRSLEKKTAAPDVHKNEIKMRLAALHKNSLKIVKKNVEKKQKELSTLVHSTETVDKAQGATEPTHPPLTLEKKLVTPTKPQTSKLQPISEVPTTEPAIDATPSKRGILRRKELFDRPPAATTHSTPRLDQTLVNSLLQTVKQRQTERNGHNNCDVTPPHIDDKMKLRVPQSEVKSKVLTSRNSSRSRSKSWELTRTSNSTSKRSGTVRSHNESKHNMPYWLKPSSAQAYPYNFIMAVRKKLESVTQPILVDPVPSIRPKTETPLARPKSSRNANPSNFRQNLEKADDTNVAHESSKAFLDMIDSIPPMKSLDEKSPEKPPDKVDLVNHEINASQSKPVSGSEEFSTNFSSISLHITDRNTMSELSSIRSEQPSNHHTMSPSKISLHVDALTSDGDDTTISSAILSQNSPAKKSKPQNFIAAPLSTEAIKDLKISSSNSKSSSQRTKNAPSRLHPFVNINTRRGDADQASNDLDQRSMVEMFETFSKNLSQVISVNERLHSALSTSIHNSNPSEQRNELKSLLKSKSHSLQEYQTDTDPIYTTSFEATNDESIQEAEGLNSHTKTETAVQSKNNEVSAETVKDLSTTKTVSEQKTGSVVVTTTIDTQTVTSQKTHILSSVPNEAVSNIDPEFRRYSTASSIVGSDIFAVFSQSDEENSLRAANQSVSCEESFNYSSIGMIDQLINNEKQKSEHLSKLMKIREKSLIDRTKGQIAWLELQKQKYKEKGLTERISAVKKKQRALLMHMATERANILKLSKLQQSPKSQRSPSKFKFQNFSAAEVNVKRTSLGNELNNASQRSAFRAYEINATQGLEEILRKREDELLKRRNHVEHLIQWHQRLNCEEDELLKMERMLMAYTSGSTTDQPLNTNHQINSNSPPKSPRKVPQDVKKIKNIEKSLQLLHNMSSTSVTTNGEEIEDVVEASGNRLNKLWRRLTGEDSEKFNAEQHYKLNKFDLEKMYEDAKNVVVVKFTKNRDIGPLNDLSLSVSVVHASTDQNSIQREEEDSNVGPMETDEPSQSSVIPSLDLNFSRESKTTSIIETNVEATDDGNDNYYFSDVKSQDASKEDHIESAATINNDKHSVESDQDNTLADTISLDNNTSSLSANSFSENIDEISFPHLKDVTSLEQTILSDTNDNSNSSNVNDSINTIAQTTTPTDALITDNVMAQEFTDNNLSDECEQDNMTDKSLQLKNSSSDDECKSVTKSNQTMFSDSGASVIVVEINDHASSSSDESKSIELEQRLIDLDDSLKDLSEAIDRAPVMEVKHTEKSHIGNSNNVNCDRPNVYEEKIDYNEVKMMRNKNINESFPTSEMIIAGKHDDLYHGSGKTASMIRDYVSPASELKMPDIISEAEVLRRQQLNIEQEIKHIDQSVPVVFRPNEIPNKPPPPYVPPAHGSPLNTIHPTDERIKEIVYRRMGELYSSISDTTTTATVTVQSQSILSENITNVYERIILDVCRECITELDIDPFTLNGMKFKQRLAFYNPPNRLEYVQEFALKKVKKLLDPNSASMGQATQIGASVKRKRDLVDEMLVMEMIEDESKWSNFDMEEKEVIENIVEQIVLLVVNEAVDDAAIWRQKPKTSVLKEC